MGLLSRYYVKETIKRRMIENASCETELENEELMNLCNEVSYIQENITKVANKAEEVYAGFFDTAGYCIQ